MERALVIHDEGDREVPFDDGASIAAAWPGARLVQTTGLGHRKILRDEAVIATVTSAITEGSPARTPLEILEEELFHPDERRVRTRS